MPEKDSAHWHKLRRERARAKWRVGLRVSRRDSDELGTVVEADGKIKVKWDGGSTSYFLHGEDVNVKRYRPPRKPP